MEEIERKTFNITGRIDTENTTIDTFEIDGKDILVGFTDKSLKYINENKEQLKELVKNAVSPDVVGTASVAPAYAETSVGGPAVEYKNAKTDVEGDISKYDNQDKINEKILEIESQIEKKQQEIIERDLYTQQESRKIKSLNDLDNDTKTEKITELQTVTNTMKTQNEAKIRKLEAEKTKLEKEKTKLEKEKTKLEAEKLKTMGGGGFFDTPSSTYKYALSNPISRKLFNNGNGNPARNIITNAVSNTLSSVAKGNVRSKRLRSIFKKTSNTRKQKSRSNKKTRSK